MRVARRKHIRVSKARVERRGQRLAAGDQSSAPPTAIPIVFFVTRLALHHLLDDLLDIPDLDEHILRLQVGMDDTAFPVQVVQAQQDLLRYLLYQRHGNASVVPLLDETEQVLA